MTTTIAIKDLDEEFKALLDSIGREKEDVVKSLLNNRVKIFENIKKDFKERQNYLKGSFLDKSDFEKALSDHISALYGMIRTLKDMSLKEAKEIEAGVRSSINWPVRLLQDSWNSVKKLNYSLNFFG